MSHYTVMQYGTGDLQFALRKVHYALLHRITNDLQFALWKLYYAAFLCRIVNFFEHRSINFLSLFKCEFRYFFHFSIVVDKYLPYGRIRLPSRLEFPDLFQADQAQRCFE